MGSEKSTAIILRVVDFSETSCVVTMMTREFGKITALAKGARRPKNPFEAAIDVLAICRIVFLHKSSSAMDLLTEAKLERRFRSATVDLQRLYAAYYVIELLRTLTEENDPHPDLFDITCQFLQEIDQDGCRDLNTKLLQYELNLLRLLGHAPMLTHCVGCGKERKTQNRVSFGLQAGGLLCHRCRPGNEAVLNVSTETINELLELSQSNEEKSKSATMLVKEDKEVKEEKRSDENSEVRKLMNQYMTHLLGYPPRLQNYLTQI